MIYSVSGNCFNELQFSKQLAVISVIFEFIG